MRTIRTYSAHGPTWGTGAHPSPAAAKAAADGRPIEVIRWRDGDADRPGLHGFGVFVAAGVHERVPHSGATVEDA